MQYLAFSIGGQAITAPHGIPDPGTNGAQALIQWGITALIAVAVILALAFLLWNGLRWVTSEGDKAKVQSARQGITYAIIGLLVAFLAIFIINLIGGVFGVDLTGHPFPKEPAKCPDGSNTYYCGETQDTQCPLCSSDNSCVANVYSIASCSNGGGCKNDSDCTGRPTSCPAGYTGVLACRNGSCVTTQCQQIGSPGGPQRQ